MRNRLERSDGSESGAPERFPWLELAILAGLIWLVHFQLFHSLGLYEDDYAFIGRKLGWKPADLVAYLKVIATWPQGRPIQFLLPPALTVLAQYLDGIRTLYIFAYVLQTTNGVLFFFLLRRLGLGTSALPGAILFSMYPADTTHTFLMHALGAHPALTFLLIAAHSYLAGHKWVAHLISAGSLLTYETAYLPFLVMPLLQLPWGASLRRELVRHVVTWLAILAMTVAVRTLLGEARIESLVAGHDFVETLRRIGLGLVIGPAVSLGLLVIGPAWVIGHWQPSLNLILIVAMAALFAGLGGASRMAQWSRVGDGAKVAIAGTQVEQAHALGARQMIQMLLVSLAMLSLAYGLSFTHFPPTIQYGRATSVHLASAFGGSLFATSLFALAMAGIRTRAGRAIIALLATLYLSVLAAYRFAIQIDFRDAWANERSFWAQVVRLVPDVSDRTLIFVLDDSLPRTRFIYTNSWADPIVLAQLHTFPNNWAELPRVFVMSQEELNSVVPAGSELRWHVPAATWPAHWEALPEGNVVLLEMENGRLVRRFGQRMLGSVMLNLKELRGSGTMPYPPGPLHPYMLGAP